MIFVETMRECSTKEMVCALEFFRRRQALNMWRQRGKTEPRKHRDRGGIFPGISGSVEDSLTWLD